MSLPHSPVLPVVVTILLALSMAGTASASPGEHSEAYGSTAGDPRVFEDGKACFDAIEETGGAARGATCDVMYVHAFDLLNWAAMNVQRPPADYIDLEQGFSSSVGVESVAGQHLYNFNELQLNSSPGFVEYQGPGEEPRWHKERGISGDVVFDTDVPIFGYWYVSADYDEFSLLSVDDVPPGSDNGPDAGILPCLTVRMVLQTGYHAGVGTDLAAGSTTKTITSAKGQEGEADPLAVTECPGAGPADVMAPEEVTEFEIPMHPIVDDMVVPASDGFVVRVEWYQFAPGEPDDEDKLYQSQINIHTGHEYLPRVALPIEGAVRIEEVDPVAFDDKVYVQVVANSPWGSYDVDPGSIALRLLDAEGTAIPFQHLAPPLLRYSVDHDGHFKPVVAVFEWDAKAQNLKPGDYTIEASAKNWQHSATAVSGTPMKVAADRIEVGEPPAGPTAPAEEAPVPGVALLVAAIGVAVLLVRRRPTA